jgi:LmbE family N-acetylglucosaminyl deacetylase
MFQLANSGADFHIPDQLPPEEALARITHLGIAAHQDDLEFMAFPGIARCFHHEGSTWFGGVICTDGSGCTRSGPYANTDGATMREIRRREQRAAAEVGRYAAVIQLDYASDEVKDPRGSRLADDLYELLEASRPQILYTHNPADKHATHIGVLSATLAALRRLPREARPQRLLGCEGWRSLDWLADDQKVAMDTSGYDHLAAALNGLFDSQIAGGKRYDLAVAGRRAANATFFDSHTTDSAAGLSFAFDLTPALEDDSLSVSELIVSAIDRFREDVRAKLAAAGID